jgi:glycogen(starch) synthase
MLAKEVIEALRERGHTVHVVCGRGCRLPNDGFTHGVMDLDLDRKEETFLAGKSPTPADAFKWHLYNHRTYRAVRSSLIEVKPDLVVIWNLYMASMAPLLAVRQSGFPMVIHAADKWLLYGLKDVGPLIWPTLRWKPLFVQLAHLFIQPILFRLAKPKPIITISEFIRKIYVEAGFDPSEIQAIHLGVPLKMFHPNGRISPSPSEVRFLCIGSLWEGKGPQVAVQALGKLIGKPDMPKLHIDFYGQGTPGFMDYLHGVVDQAGVKDHVTFHGFIDRSDLPDIQRQHDILLFPSMWDEPFAAVPVEAMACGTPVIATTAGGTPEAIEDGRTGLLVPPNDPSALATAMERLIRDPQLRRALGEEAARVAREKYDFRRYVDRLEEQYQEITGLRLAMD